MYQEFVVWGLRNQRHSHRFIHKSFYDNLMKMNLETYWYPDSIRVELSPFKRRLVIASGVASQNLQILPNTDYVLHNVHLSERQQYSAEILNTKILNLQVYTNSASGEKNWNSPFISLDVKGRTLYQPWGTPTPRREWNLATSDSYSQTEFWVGAIWNNNQNQGNAVTMEEYKKVLASRSIDFKRVGGSRLRKGGISESKAAEFVRMSRIGASIVGKWQQESQYVPCRVFKNISSGVAPISNGDYRALFQDSQIFSEQIESLVDEALSESQKSKNLRLKTAQDAIQVHTYEANLQRIFESMELL